MIPEPWTFALLAIAAYRTWRLIAEDTILYSLRLRVIRHEKVVEFIACPWCLGSWVALAWWLAWWQWPHDTLVAAGIAALMAAVGIVATTLHRIAGDE